MKEKLSIKNIHIFLIVIGIIFTFLGLFHSNIWFDEAYSVGIANKPFIDIWKIGSHDVHPVLYYWILHLIYMLFHGSVNASIMAYRIFSGCCIATLGILGFTHIRKDFGEKTGLLFTFFAYFMPVTCAYAEEVRMYALACLLVTILSIYAYKLSKEDSNKNWIIFGIASLASIYVHYYGLMSAGLINVVLLVFLIVKKRKSSIIKILSLGVLQLIVYIPWIMCLITQMKQVSSGFWISLEFPKSVIEILGTQFTGNTKSILGFIVALVIYTYLIFKAKKTAKNKENWKPGVWAISIYLMIIIAALIVTVVLHSAILYYRYLFVVTGLYIFFISYFVGREKNKYIVGIICIITVTLGIWSNFMQIQDAYDKTNMTQIEYLNENVQEGDIFTFNESTFGSGSVVAVNYPEHKQYYYNPSNWHVEEAYRAFGDQLSIYTDESFMEKLNGRIWIVDDEGSNYYNKFFNNDDYKLISRKEIRIKYENYLYNLILVEKITD